MASKAKGCAVSVSCCSSYSPDFRLRASLNHSICLFLSTSFNPRFPFPVPAESSTDARHGTGGLRSTLKLSRGILANLSYAPSGLPLRPGFHGILSRLSTWLAAAAVPLSPSTSLSPYECLDSSEHWEEKTQSGVRGSCDDGLRNSFFCRFGLLWPPRLRSAARGPVGENRCAGESG